MMLVSGIRHMWVGAAGSGFLAAQSRVYLIDRWWGLCVLPYWCDLYVVFG